MDSLDGRGIRALLAVAALACSAALVPSAHAASDKAGSVRFAKKAGYSEFDRFTRRPSPAMKQMLRDRYARMVVSSPYFDSRLSWYSRGWVYRNLYSVSRSSSLARRHPSWILRQRNGSRSYINFDCNGRTCPQLAGDIANPRFRKWWIASTRARVRKGYRGIYIDDVNMFRRVGNANGRETTPYSRYLKRAISRRAWRVYVARFTRQIRRAFRKKEIVHNVIWYAPGYRDRIGKAQLRSANVIALERGVNDAGLTGGGGRYGLRRFLNFTGYIHRLKRRVYLDETAETEQAREYGLAGYLLINDGRDFLGSDPFGNPDRWWRGYGVRLGAPRGARRRSGSLMRRDFRDGVVLLNEPGATTKTVALKGNYRTADGRAVGSSITLAASRGAVLVRSR